MIDKRCMTAGILLGLMGFAVNWFKYTLFFGVDFIFGGAFAMFAMIRFGTSAGITAGFISSLCTYLLWSTPWSIIIFTLESISVGILFRKEKSDILSWDILFWLTAGPVLVWFFYHIVIGLPGELTTLIILKQALNGVFCALAAQSLNFFLINLCDNKENRPTFQKYTFTIMVILVVIPALILKMSEIREQLQRRYEMAADEITHADEITRNMISRWIAEQHYTISALAKMADNPDNLKDKELQKYAESFLAASGLFKRLGIMNSQGISVAYAPPFDELGNSNIGKDFSDRPYLSIITHNDKPYVGDVVMGMIGKPTPILPLVTPIFRDNIFRGYSGGVLELDHIKKILKEIVSGKEISLTLLDRNGKIICSTKDNQNIMSEFSRPEGYTTSFFNEVKQWIPKQQKGLNKLERWRRAYFFTETVISESIPWKIITEFPVDPILRILTKTTCQGFALTSLIVIIATILSHLISRWIASSIVNLQKTVDMIPHNLETMPNITWPKSHIMETDILARKFEDMVVKQRNYITEINHLNKNLEAMVEKRTRELKEATDEINSYFNASLDLFCISDSSGCFRKLNPAWENTLGYSLSELEGHKLMEFVHPDDRNITSITTEIASINPVNNFLNRYIRKDNSIRWLEWRSIPIGDRIYSAARDVSDRMIMESALRQSEEKYRSVLSAMHEGVIMRTSSGKISACNQKAQTILGYTEEKMIGYGFCNPEWDAINEDGSPFFEENHPAYITLKTGKPVTGTVMGIRKPGKDLLWLLVNSGPFFDPESGEVAAVVTTFSDITDRKNTEEAVRKNESLFRSIFEQAAVGVALLEAGSGKFHRINKRYCEILGYNEEEIAGKSIFEFAHPDDATAIISSLKNLEDGKKVLSLENRHIRKDERHVWVNISISPVIFQGATPNMLVAVAQDITAIKDAEDALYEINKTLEQRVVRETKSRMEKERMLVQQSKMAAMGEMIGAIAHQWRQPLNATGAIIQDIKHAEESGCLDSKYLSTAVYEAMQQIRFMSRTIDDFRNFFKTDKYKSRFGVKKAISQVYSMLASQLKTLSIQCMAGCHIQDEDSLVPCRIFDQNEDHYITGFENEFKQVLLNLITNARDAIVENSKKNAATNHEKTIGIDLRHENNKTMITVSDTGGGIPHEILGRIFDPYFTTKEQGKGTGIGLYMSKMIIEKNMGGELTAGNGEKGAEFKITLMPDDKQ